MTVDHARKNAARIRAAESGQGYIRANAAARCDRSPEPEAAVSSRFVLSGFPGGYYPGVKRDHQWMVDVFRDSSGRGLPRGLAPYSAPAHSWESFIQDELNGATPRARCAPAGPAALRDYQEAQVARPAAALRRGAPGYLWAFPTGSGKTPMAIRAACALAGPGTLRILVVTRLAVIPAWRAAIDRFAAGAHRWVVANPERLWRLLDCPHADLDALAVEDAVRVVTAEGASRVGWDVVIVDECHMLANAQSQRAHTMRRLVQRPQGGRAFVLWASATPFTTPLESAYVSGLIAFAAGVDAPGEDVDYRLWLKELGLRLNTDRAGRWFHRFNRPDVTELRRLLYEAGVGAAASPEELSLPVQEREVVPLALSAQDRARYELTWQEFRRAENLAVFEGSEPGSYRVEALRRVQKASLLKAPYVARLVVEQVRQGRQVVVPMWFVESIDKFAVNIARGLREAGLDDRVVAITGRDSHLRERKRVAFQLGEAKVMVLNALEGINAQAGEENTDGHGARATDAARVCVIADVLTGGKRALQAEGRTQRDGRSAPVVYAYAAGTGEQEWTAATFRSLSNTLSLARNDRDASMFACLADEISRRGTA